MKVLFVGDSPTVSTGFAVCTRAACDALHARGHEVTVLGINAWLSSASTRRYPYDIEPCIDPTDCGHEPTGTTRLPRLIDRLSPDVVVILQDPWNIPEYFTQCRKYGLDKSEMPPVVGWLAVDSENQDGTAINELAAAFAWTKFGVNELRTGGATIPLDVVPLGVDLDTFKPRDRTLSRLDIFAHMPELPQNAFIVGAVGRNQLRKRLDLTIRYFAHWIDKHSITDAYLFLHVAPTGDGGADLSRLARYYGIDNRVIISRPHVGTGDSLSTLVKMYNCLDVYVTTSQAEGWGLPALEAMACGIPCILPDFAAFDAVSGWPGNNCHHVAVGATCLTAPMASTHGGGANAYTLGAVPDETEFIAALNDMYRAPKHRQAIAQRGHRHAQTLSLADCGQNFAKALESVVSAPPRDTDGAPLTTPTPAATMVSEGVPG